MKDLNSTRENARETLASSFKGSFIISARVPVVKNERGRYAALVEIPPQLFKNPQCREMFTIFSRN